MRAMLGLSSLFVLIIATATPARAATDTFIESADGKRLIRLESPELDQPYHAVSDAASGKTIVYVNKNEVLKDIHDPAILVVDDSTVRHTAAGVKLATFDDDDIRHGAGGKVVMNYHHPDLCPDAHSKRVYRVDGPELTKAQLTAVLYALKPDLFKLTDAETAAQQKEMKEAEAESDRLAAADQIAGKWTVLNSSGPVEKTGQGTITVAPKKGEAYPVTFDLAAGGGPAWQGVGAYKEMDGDKLFWVAYGSPKTIALCVYEIKGATLEGTWFPFYVDGDAKNTGSETLKGPATLDGDYTIAAAKTPSTGVAYTGKVSIHPAKIVGASDDQAPYLITWTIGTAKINGIGIRHKNFLFVSSGAGPDVNIATYKINNGTMSADWYKLGSTEKGSAAAMTAN